MRGVVEAALTRKRFHLPSFAAAATARLLSSTPTRGLIGEIGERTAKREMRALLEGALRASHLIEVDVDGKGTKFDSRWGPRLRSGDRRRASPATCDRILSDLLADLVESLGHLERAGLWKLFVGQRLLPYELPIDLLDPTARRVHVPGNVAWIWGDADVEASILLRSALRQPAVVGRELKDLARLLKKKVMVKVYQTDRELTGAFQTNREKRWETKPDSPQFATRRACLSGERELMTQVVHMAGFPAAALHALWTSGSLERREVTRCPVTLDPLEYHDLIAELSERTHGLSKFHVGHLDPLSGAGLHTGTNLAWVSDLGNRLQGNATIAQTRATVVRIHQNYKRFGIIP